MEVSSFVLILQLFSTDIELGIFCHRGRNKILFLSFLVEGEWVLLLLGSSQGPQRGCGPASLVTDEETEAGEVRDLPGRTMQPTGDTNGTQTLSACLQSPHLVHMSPLDATWTTCSFSKDWKHYP